MVLKQVSEEDCWFVIGAHQAGASERQCSELSGLSKTVTHNIIRNFKKLGSPHANNLSVQALLHKDTNVVKKRKTQEGLVENDTPRKRGRPRKPAEPPYFTQHIVKQALYHARDGQKTVYSYKHSTQVYPLDRLDTPPSDEDQLQTIGLKIEQRGDSNLDYLPLTPSSGIAMDGEEEEEEEEAEVGGDQVWSMEDDKALLMHVLGLPLKHVKWKDVESQFQDRHLAKMCADRWDYIKKQMLKDIDLITSTNKKDEFL